MTEDRHHHVTMLGAGAWGTAVAQVLAENGCKVTLWSYEQEVFEDIEYNRMNSRYLPGVKLHPYISATCDLADAVSKNEWIFEAIPVMFVRSVLEPVKQHIHKNATWIILSKGIEFHNMLFPAGIIGDILGKPIPHVVVSGPSFAQELAAHQPTATSIASHDPVARQYVSSMLCNSYFKCVECDDVIGIQLGGALKNVIALSLGIAQGLGYKSNTSAYLLTLGLKEIEIIMTSFGAQPQTAYSLAVLGDLILTCTGTLSKNLRAGRLLTQNRDITYLEENFGALPEGINTIKSVHDLMKKNGLRLPICKATYEYIFNQGSFDNFWAQ